MGEGARRQASASNCTANGLSQNGYGVYMYVPWISGILFSGFQEALLLLVCTKDHVKKHM